MEKKLLYGQLASVVLLTCLAICLTPLHFALAVLCIVTASAFILADAYDIELYTVYGMDSEAGKDYYLNYIKNAAMHVLPIDVSTEDTLVVLSTCTEDITNGRFILVGKMVDKPFKEPPKDAKRTFGLGLGNSTGFWALLPLWKWFIIFAIIILMLIYALTILLERWRQGKLSEDAYVLYDDDIEDKHNNPRI